jgi:hypothetical protein
VHLLIRRRLHQTTSSTDVNTTQIPFITIQNDQSASTHEKNKLSQLLFLWNLFSSNYRKFDDVDTAEVLVTA